MRQILDIHMQIAGRVSFERLVLRSGRFRLQIAQIADAMPPQTAVQARARDLRVQELAQRAIAGAIGSSPMASASRSSSDTNRVLRSTTATASCAGVSVVCK